MVCNCCIRVISDEFEKAGLQIEKIELGSVTINNGKQKAHTKKIREILNRVGFDIITERDHQIVEIVKLGINITNNANYFIQYKLIKQFYFTTVTLPTNW
jgi:AraC family transcriptional regulator